MKKDYYLLLHNALILLSVEIKRKKKCIMKVIFVKAITKAYEALDSASSAAHVFPRVVITTPAMLTKTATTFDTFKVSWPISTPMKRVKSPEVDDNTVVLATLVRARAAFDRY